MTEKFVTNKAIHLKGSKLQKCLQLDQDRKCFTYLDPTTRTLFECDGVIQVKIGLQYGHDLNNVPFLPVRDGNKTFRALCAICLRERRREKCTHKTIEERSWRGTYSMTEVAYAVCELKYTLLEVEEAVCYTSQDYIFRDYFKLLAIQKIKHVPLPPNVDPKAHCERVNRDMNLTHPLEILKPHMLKPDKAAVAFTKAVMNFSLGKLCQRPNLRRVEIVREHDKLIELFMNPQLEMHTCFHITPTVLQISYETKAPYVGVNRAGQLIENGLLTAKARVLLDRHLRGLLQRQASIKYIDTDSCIFTIGRGQDHGLVLGNSLGQWKDEAWPETYMAKYAAISPKNYAFQLNSKETHLPVASVTKIRGISLHQNDQIRASLNIELLQDFVQALQQEEKVSKHIPQGMIRICQKTKLLQPYELKKCYSNTVDDPKRFYLPKVHPSKLWSFGTCSFDV